jgi:hypothetical protein
MMLSGAGTWILLVGTGTYAPGSGLESVPAVSSTLADLGQVQVERCGVAPERLRVLRDPESSTQLGVALAEEAEQATEVLLFYYVGHGVISPGGQLYAATGATDRRPTRLTHTALAYPAVREDRASTRPGVVQSGSSWKCTTGWPRRYGQESRTRRSSIRLPDRAHGIQ